MRIGIDARLWNQTGVGRYTRNLVRNLLILDKNNTYILFVRKQDYGIINDQLLMIKHQNKLKIKNWKLEIADIKWHSIAEQIKFPKILEKENLDLVHFPYFSLPIFYKKPYVVTIHDLIINHYPTGKASTLFPLLYYSKLLSYKFIIYQASKNAKKIIVPSIATKNEVIDHLKIADEKIVVTPEAADQGLRIKNSELRINKYGKYFLYVGNAYPHKNLDRLIQAFNVFHDQRPKTKDLKLILVGRKDYFYKRLEQKTKSQNIIFYGVATDAELSNLYKNSLCLVMPSLMEGFGLPVLEAMANKCLVACSDIPSLREVVKDNALYFNPKNITEIQEAMSNVYDQKYKKEITENAYAAAKEFSFEKMAKETLKIYESCFSI
nr:glycosyltransferase family 4 protein [Candidatus Levybacteria bacterium]